MKSETDYYYLALAVLTLVNIGLGLFNVYLSRSGIIFDFATGLVFNMAILSLVIVVSGVLVTVFGLARLQSIERKAIEEARITARRSLSNELASIKKLMPEVKEKLQEVAEMSDSIKEEISKLSSSEISDEEEQEETENDLSGN